MRYKLVLTPEAERHLDEWRKSGQKKTLLKIAALLEELCEHPTTGTGKVEQLKGDLEGYWSRRIKPHASSIKLRKTSSPSLSSPLRDTTATSDI